MQFAPVHYNGGQFLPGQANNFYIFPAVGMAIFATQAKRVTDEMFIEAAQEVADQVPSELLKKGLLYPLQSNILEIEIQTAARVAKLVFDSGLAQVDVLRTWSRSSANMSQARIFRGGSRRLKRGLGRSGDEGRPLFPLRRTPDETALIVKKFPYA